MLLFRGLDVGRCAPLTQWPSPHSGRSPVLATIVWPARIGAWLRDPGLRGERSRPIPARAYQRKSVDSFRPIRAVVPDAGSGVPATPAVGRPTRSHSLPPP